MEYTFYVFRIALATLLRSPTMILMDWEFLCFVGFHVFCWIAYGLLDFLCIFGLLMFCWISYVYGSSTTSPLAGSPGSNLLPLPFIQLPLPQKPRTHPPPHLPRAPWLPRRFRAASAQQCQVATAATIAIIVGVATARASSSTSNNSISRRCRRARNNNGNNKSSKPSNSSSNSNSNSSGSRRSSGSTKNSNRST